MEKKDKALSDADSNYTDLVKERKEQAKEIKKLQSQLKNQENLALKEEKEKVKKESLLQAARGEKDGCKNVIKELERTCKAVEEEKKQLVEEKDSVVKELEVVKDCLLQIKTIQNEFMEEGDEKMDNELVEEKQKEKLKELMNCAKLKSSLRNVEKERKSLVNEINFSRKTNKDMEEKLIKLEVDLQHASLEKARETQSRISIETKLETLTKIYAEKDVAYQGQLGKEKSELQIVQSRLAVKEDSTTQLLEQLSVYKEMNEASQREHSEAEKQRKNEINQFEKKAHSNWLASREAERKLDEANREVSSLRTELGSLHQRLREMEDFDHPIVRPRPIPPSSRNFTSHSPLPMHDRHSDSPRGGPRFDKRRPPSPSDSLSEEQRSIRSRPPSQARDYPPGPPPHDFHMGPPLHDLPHMGGPIGPPPHMRGPPPMGPPDFQMGPPLLQHRNFSPFDSRGPPRNDSRGPPPHLHMMGPRGGPPPPQLDMTPPPHGFNPDGPPHLRGPGDGTLITSSPLTDRDRMQQRPPQHPPHQGPTHGLPMGNRGDVMRNENNLQQKIMNPNSGGIPPPRSSSFQGGF